MDAAAELGRNPVSKHKQLADGSHITILPVVTKDIYLPSPVSA